MACILVLGCSAPDVSRLKPGSTWTGYVDLPGVMHKHITMRFHADGSRVSAELDVPSSGTRALKIPRVRVTDRGVEFDVPLESGRAHRFEGTFGAHSIRGPVTGMPAVGTFELFPGVRSPPPAVSSGGIDERKLTEGIAWIERNAPDVRAILVLHRDRLVAERYFAGAQASDAFNVKSVTKSILSAATGVALRNGVFRSLDERLLAILPERAAQIGDRDKQRITLRHLGTMTAGLQWQENGPTTSEWIASTDSVGYLLRLPQEHPPGEAFHYNSGLAHLLSAALARRARVPTRQYVEEHVLHPIGASIVRWDRDPAGFEDGGSELYMTARDMAKFGQLYLHGGRWNGRQLIDPRWVETSTRAQSQRNPLWADYGFLWWLEQNDDLRSFAALGYGGQAIWITPALDLVVVIASTPSNPRNDPRHLIVEHILPAVAGSMRCGLPDERNETIL